MTDWPMCRRLISLAVCMPKTASFHCSGVGLGPAMWPGCGMCSSMYVEAGRMLKPSFSASVMTAPSRESCVFLRHAHQDGKGAQVRPEGKDVFGVDAPRHDDVGHTVFFQEGEGLADLPYAEFPVLVAQGNDRWVGFPLEAHGHDAQVRRVAARSPDDVFRIGSVTGYQT